MEASRREEHELVDEELARLPDKYRLPLLLCYFEGRTLNETAAQLGWPAGKVRGLLDRGRERLRFRLLRRGLSPAAAGSATLLTSTARSAAVSPPLAAATLQAALNVVSGQSLAVCGVSATVAKLTKGGLTMGPKKVLILALMLVAGALGGGAVIWASSGQNRAAVQQQALIAIGHGNVDAQTAENADQNSRQVAADQRVILPSNSDAGQNKAPDEDAKLPQEKKQYEDPDEAMEQAVIARLIGVMKSDAFSIHQRVRACYALARRGAKAKAAVPEIIRFFDWFSELPEGEEREKAKFNMYLPQLAQVLGLIQTQETFACLQRALNRDGSSVIQDAVLQGLARMAWGPNNDLKFKARVELQVFAETSPQLRMKAKLILDTPLPPTSLESLLEQFGFHP